MRRLIASAILTVAPVAAQADGASGCGWGAMLFDGSSGLAPHVVAVTTNGTSGNNTFGMTSGTNGCTTNETIRYRGTKKMVDANMERMVEDVARGGGETLEAVAVLFGIAPEDRAHFYETMQGNFATLYPHAEVNGAEVVDAMVALMEADEVLRQYIS